MAQISKTKVVDVIGDLKRRDLYLEVNPYIKKDIWKRLPIGVIVSAVLTHASTQAEEEGMSWVLSSEEIRDLFELPSNTLSIILSQLETQGVLTSTGTKNKMWSPQWHMGSEGQAAHIIRITQGGDNTRILQSPLSVNTPELFSAVRDSQTDLCNIGYTLISYDYGAFTGDTEDLNLKVFHGLDKNEVALKATWLAINETRVLPVGLELSSDNFWNIATPSFLADRNKLATQNSPAPLWRSAPEALWGAHITELKRAQLFNKLCQDFTVTAKEAEDAMTRPWEPVAKQAIPNVIEITPQENKPEPTATPGRAPTAPSVVRNAATQSDLARYREEHGHGPIVGNPIERDFADRRRAGEFTKPNGSIVSRPVVRTISGNQAFGYNTEGRRFNRYENRDNNRDTNRPYNKPYRNYEQRPAVTTPAPAPVAAVPVPALAPAPAPAPAIAAPKMPETPRELDSLAIVNDIVRSNLPKDTQKHLLDMLVLYGRFSLFPDKFKRNDA